MCRRALAWMVVAAPVVALGQELGFVPLFPNEGPPKGWVVRAWNDVAKAPAKASQWVVKDGVLSSGKERGNWLMSERAYGDFILELEIKIGKLGNSGIALRAPLKGDPAFDGMEFQVADYFYNLKALDSELSGGIYRAIAPNKQVYKPTEWNAVRIELVKDRLKATLNGVLIQDVDLSKHDKIIKRHDGTDAPAIKDRPRIGHLGLQHLSRDTEPVLVRKARLKVLKP
jgi:hypothetical protein